MPLHVSPPVSPRVGKFAASTPSEAEVRVTDSGSREWPASTSNREIADWSAARFTAAGAAEWRQAWPTRFDVAGRWAAAGLTPDNQVADPTYRPLAHSVSDTSAYRPDIGGVTGYNHPAYALATAHPMLEPSRVCCRLLVSQGSDREPVTVQSALPTERNALLRPEATLMRSRSAVSRSPKRTDTVTHTCPS